MKPGRKFCRLGDLAAQVGWKHDALIHTLEAKRKESATKYYTTKKTATKSRTETITKLRGQLATVDKQLIELGGMLPYPVHKKPKKVEKDDDEEQHD